MTLSATSRRGALFGLAGLAGCAVTNPASPPALGSQRARTPPAPPPLTNRLAEIAAGFDGRYGISIRAAAAGWTAHHDGDALYPQQSVAKLWTALAVFDAVDRGRLKLDLSMHVTAADMSVFHQPIRDRLVAGALDISVEDLLTGAIARSDNACDDILIRLVGGPDVVQKAIDSRGLGAIRGGPEERFLQSWIAGLTWRPGYAVADNFEQARQSLDPQLRSDRLKAYLADPPEGATPNALTAALARLASGDLLSAASTARYLQILTATTTGPQRLKAGLAPGWTIAHKTGTGQDFFDVSTGYNDVAIVTAPDGRVFTIAAMIASTTRDIPERMAVMQATSRALVTWREGLLR